MYPALYFWARFLELACKKANVYLKNWSRVRILRSHLHALSEDEKSALRFYFLNNTKTRVFDISDGTISGLNSLGIVYRPSTVSCEYTRFAYNIQPWAWSYIKKRPHLLRSSNWRGKPKDSPIR